MLYKFPFYRNRHLIRSVNQVRLLSSIKKDISNTPLTNLIKNLDDDLEDKPVVYSTSKAAKFKTAENFRSIDINSPPSQWYFVTISTVIFLIYFCLLREENDIDERLYEPWAGNEKIYKKILEVQMQKDDSTNEQIKKKIQELEDKIKINVK